MLISDFRIHSIAMADPPLRSSYGLHQPYALRNVIELVSDDGVIGIAETYGGDQPAGALEAIRGKVIGTCPYRLTGDLSPMVEGGASGLERSQTYNVPGENPLDADARTYSAIETACLDLIGKTVGKPVCDLIGGRVRDKVPFSAYPFYKHAGGGGEGDDLRDDEYGEALSPESLVAQVQQLRAKYGFGSIKFKGGVLAPDVEIETLRQLRQALGQAVPLRIDPNCAWSVETSVKVGRDLAGELSGGGYLEDPCVGLDGMAEVRRRLMADGIGTPLASNVAPRRRSSGAVRSPLLGWHAARAATCARLQDIRHRPVDALEQPPRRFAHGDGARRIGDDAPHLRLRYALPVAVGN